MRARDKGDMTRCETTSQAHHPVLVVDGESVDPKITEMGRVGKGWTREKEMHGHQLVVDDAMVQRRAEKGGSEQN
jgi:predicted RNA-binding protein with TRAM domain